MSTASLARGALWPLSALPRDSKRLQLFFARFDIGIMRAYLVIMDAPLYCTRTASRRCAIHRPPRPQVCQGAARPRSLEQLSPRLWRAGSELTRISAATCASSALKEKLYERLAAKAAELAGLLDFLPQRALLDLAGWAEQDIFAHDG